MREGGHNVPIDVIVRRYKAGIDNLFKIYIDIVDSWMIIENYQTPRIVIADGKRNDKVNIHNVELYKKIKDYVR